MEILVSSDEFRPCVVFAYAEGKNWPSEYTDSDASCMKEINGRHRILVNGEKGDEWNEDKISQAYGQSMLVYYQQNYNPNIVLKPSYGEKTNKEQAWINGFSYWFSASFRNNPLVHIGDYLYDISKYPIQKGIDYSEDYLDGGLGEGKKCEFKIYLTN